MAQLQHPGSMEGIRPTSAEKQDEHRTVKLLIRFPYKEIVDLDSKWYLQHTFSLLSP
jgi:hypothetical protein